MGGSVSLVVERSVTKNNNRNQCLSLPYVRAFTSLLNLSEKNIVKRCKIGKSNSSNAF